MNTQHLKYAVEVERTGSITQAADNLYMEMCIRDSPIANRAARRCTSGKKGTDSEIYSGGSEIWHGLHFQGIFITEKARSMRLRHSTVRDVYKRQVLYVHALPLSNGGANGILIVNIFLNCTAGTDGGILGGHGAEVFMLFLIHI